MLERYRTNNIFSLYTDQDHLHMQYHYSKAHHYRPNHIQVTTQSIILLHTVYFVLHYQPSMISLVYLQHHHTHDPGNYTHNYSLLDGNSHYNANHIHFHKYDIDVNYYHYTNFTSTSTHLSHNQTLNYLDFIYIQSPHNHLYTKDYFLYDIMDKDYIRLSHTVQIMLYI